MLGAAALLAVVALPLTQAAEAQTALTYRERLSAERDPLPVIEELTSPYTLDKSVVVAQVIQVQKQSDEAYARFRRESPTLDPEEHLPVVAGSLHVVERLSGPATPSELTVEPVDPRDAGLPIIGPGPKGNSFRMKWMRPGEYWIIVYDTTAEPGNRRFVYAWLLRWPDDTVLALYRRYIAWLSEPNAPQAYAKMRTVLFSPDASLPSRRAALQGMVMRGSLKKGGLVESADYPFVRRTMLDLLQETDLPSALRLAAIGALHVDASRELVAGSDDVATLRYLLDVIKNETDRDLLRAAAATLEGMGRQSFGNSQNYTVYHFPEILQALERRELREGADNSPVLMALMNLRRSMAADKDAVVVIRRLPFSQ